jgi:hypothetical protein
MCLSSIRNMGQLGLLGHRFLAVHGVVRDHVIARGYGAMLQSRYQMLFSHGENKKAPLKLRESANTNFLLARDNQMKRHKVHPSNYPGCPPFQERMKRKRQPSSGEVTRALLLTYLLRLLAPTLVAAFHKAPTPDFRYLEHRSNHSATVAFSKHVQANL